MYLIVFVGLNIQSVSAFVCSYTDGIEIYGCVSEQSYLENILSKTNPIVMLLVDIWEFVKIRDRYF